MHCVKFVLGGGDEADWIKSGTYIHPDLVPSVAGWISADFQIKANRVVNAYIVRQYKNSIAEYEAKVGDLESHLEILETYHLDQLNELQDVLKEKENIIETTQVQLELCTSSELQHKRAKLEAVEAKEEAMEQCDAAKLVAHQQLQQTQELEKTVHEKEMVVAVKDNIIKRKKLQLDTWAKTHTFTMMRLNQDDKPHAYYAIRRARNTRTAAIKKLRSKFPCSIMIYQHLNVPNPVNMYNRLKASGVLTFNKNYCTSRVTELDLINKIGHIYNVVK